MATAASIDCAAHTHQTQQAHHLAVKAKRVPANDQGM